MVTSSHYFTFLCKDDDLTDLELQNLEEFAKVIKIKVNF